jgi:hypothetical protein
MMSDRSRAETEERASAGDAEAQLALSRICANENRNDLALEWLQRAAGGGNLEAKASLGKIYLTDEAFITQADRVREGIALTMSAAQQGDGEALHAAALLCAGGLGVQQDWDRALDYLVRSAESGNALAQKELTLLSHTRVQASGPEAPDNWQKLREKVVVPSWLNFPRPSALSSTPRIAVIRKFFSDEICEWLIERAKPRLAPAQLYDPETGERKKSQSRSNSAVMFGLFDMDMVLLLQWLRIAKLTGIPGGAEHPNILHYAPGESYAPHFDFIEPNAAGAARGLTQGGQRVFTFLVYLNEDYDGGETEFPLLSLRFKGNKGDALFFWNVDAHGAPDRLTLHTGTAPTSGEKWLFSQWVDG